MIELRHYQQAVVDKAREALRRVGRVCVQMPTGAGKTAVGAHMVATAVSRGRRVVWLAHRSELIDQAYDTLKKAGLSVSAVCASSSRKYEPRHPVQVASVQTLLARGEAPPADFLVFDEAHHAPSALWSTVPAAYGAVKFVGFTATPERADGAGLGSVFDEIVVGPSVAELVACGALVPCHVIRPKRPLMTREIAQRPIDAWRKYAGGRKAIVFSPDVRWATIHRDEFREAGHAADLVTGESSDRDRILRQFRKGHTRVLVNVYVLTEGTDIPDVECVILARGCGTAGTYLQMVGRALRPAPGKIDAMLLDLSGASHKHGTPEEPREYSLDGKGIRRVTAAVDTYCRVCGCVVDGEPPCPHCGHMPDPSELKITNDPLAKFAAKRRETDEERFKTLLKWIRACDEKGHNRRAVFYKWKHVYDQDLSEAWFRKAQRDVDHAADPVGDLPDGSGRRVA